RDCECPRLSGVARAHDRAPHRRRLRRQGRRLRGTDRRAARPESGASAGSICPLPHGRIPGRALPPGFCRPPQHGRPSSRHRDRDKVPAGAVLRNSGLVECIERTQDWVRGRSSKAVNQGLGVALGTWAYGPKAGTAESAATVKIDVDGSVVVLTGAADQGGGQWSLVAQIASQVLGVPMDRVSLVAADTESTPIEGGIGGSNATYRVGNSVRQAAEDAREKLIIFASERLKVDPEELLIEDGELVVRSDKAQRLSIAEAAHAATTSAAGAIIGTSANVREREVQDHGREQ